MNAGEFANLQCIVPTGDLPLNIRWSYPGEEMGGSSGVIAKKVADRVSMLMISVITARHAGEYVCTAENAAGTASHSTILTVNGSGLRSVPREHSLFHTWVAFYHPSPPMSRPLHRPFADNTTAIPSSLVTSPMSALPNPLPTRIPMETSIPYLCISDWLMKEGRKERSANESWSDLCRTQVSVLEAPKETISRKRVTLCLLTLI